MKPSVVERSLARRQTADQHTQRMAPVGLPVLAAILLLVGVVVARRKLHQALCAVADLQVT